MSRVILSLILLCALAFSLGAQAVNVDQNDLAVKGYDVVAYFTQSKPVKGSADIRSKHDGAVYYFSSEEHRTMFDKSPEKYVPAYGGYCAYAVAKGSTASIQPRQWTIHKDRLYLNFSSGTRRAFVSDINGMVSTADGNWPRIKSRLDRR